MTQAIVVLSGGLDSTTLLYDTIDLYGSDNVKAVSFDYGQRHVKELQYAKASCNKFDIEHTVVDLTAITGLLGASSLTNPDIDVPEGHYAEDSMKATVVPNRNMIMLAIAAGYAVTEQAHVIATAVHAGDHFVYPDCRPAFIDMLRSTIAIGNEGFIPGNFHIWTPYIFQSKTTIAVRASELGVPFNETWSCYKGGEKHCGKCGTCVERIEAIYEAGLAEEDTTEYEIEFPYGRPDDGSDE